MPKPEWAVNILGLVGAAMLGFAGDPSSNGVVEINSTGLVFEGEAPRPVSFTFDRSSVEAAIPRLPEGATIYLQCNGHTPEGRLTGCSLDLTPQGRGFEAAATTFSDSVRLSEGIRAEGRGDEVQIIWIQVTLWNWTQRPSVPCRPPGCSRLPDHGG